MRRKHEHESEDISKLGWTTVTLGCWPDGEIESWLKNHNSNGQYIQSYLR